MKQDKNIGKDTWVPDGIKVDDLERFIESKMWKAILQILDFQRDAIIQEITTESSLDNVVRLQGEYKFSEFTKTIPMRLILHLDPEYIEKQLKKGTK